MCGISGIFSSAPIDRAVLESMTQSLRHRGPDAQGVWLDETSSFGLGHNRLSVIDLSAEADQPFVSADGRYVIVFNGEIYNFQTIRQELIDHHGIQFRTHSDTEVILQAFAVWGPVMVERLEGMFSLAIADVKQSNLFLCRDRIGKKPLYYYEDRGLFIFASEIKSLLRHPVVIREKNPNRQAIADFLHLGYIPEPHTIYTRIRKFPAGSSGTVNRNQRLVIQRYWKFEDRVRRPRVRDDREAIARLGTLLDRAVEQRLISDVPLGTFLSGGTDSSLVTALASRHRSSPIKTFSIGFKESKFDESRYACLVARHLKTDHTEYILTQRDAVDQMELYLRHFDEPFADTSAIPTLLVSGLARAAVKVVLTGDGGDELFQGYGAYRWADRLGTVGWRAAKLPLHWILSISGSSRLQRVAHLLEPGVRGSLRSHIFSQEQYYFSQREVERLLRDSSGVMPFDYDESFLSGTDFTPGERQAIFDLQYYLKDDLLVKVDRASMYHALECRCPFLDPHVIEYAFSLDVELKKRSGKTKWIEKELLREFLPDTLVDRPKWGFSIPLGAWLKGDLRYLMDEFLEEHMLDEAGLCHTHSVLELKKQFLAGSDYLYHRLWAVIVLHKWWKENR